MIHDPLCPYQPEKHTNCEMKPGVMCAVVHYTTGVNCQCDLIAMVRKDEQMVIYAEHLVHDYERSEESWETGYKMGRSIILEKCIEVIEYLHDYEAPHDSHKDALWNAISVLRAMQE